MLQRNPNFRTADPNSKILKHKHVTIDTKTRTLNNTIVIPTLCYPKLGLQLQKRSWKVTTTDMSEKDIEYHKKGQNFPVNTARLRRTREYIYSEWIKLKIIMHYFYCKYSSVYFMLCLIWSVYTSSV
jgi:hypothetical protein